MFVFTVTSSPWLVVWNPSATRESYGEKHIAPYRQLNPKLQELFAPNRPFFILLPHLTNLPRILHDFRAEDSLFRAKFERRLLRIRAIRPASRRYVLLA